MKKERYYYHTFDSRMRDLYLSNGKAEGKTTKEYVKKNIFQNKDCQLYKTFDIEYKDYTRTTYCFKHNPSNNIIWIMEEVDK